MDYFLFARKGTLVDLVASKGSHSIPLAIIGYIFTMIKELSVGAMQIKTLEPRIEIEICDLYSYHISRFNYIMIQSIFYKLNISIFISKFYSVHTYLIQS